MSSSPSEHELVQAVLGTIDSGAYPESESVASAELPVGVLSKLQDAVNQARNNVKAEIRNVSRSAAPDIDGWISQAKQLQVEIEHSKAVAREIVQQAQAGHCLRDEYHDASNKVALLREEMAFNEDLSETLERISSIKKVLEEAEAALGNGKLLEGIDSLVEAEERITTLEGYQELRRYAAMIQEKASKLRTVVVETVGGCWRDMVLVANNKLTFEREVEQHPGLDIEKVVQAMLILNMFDFAVSRLARDIDRNILMPRYMPGESTLLAINVRGSTIQSTESLGDNSNKAAIEDARQTVEFMVAKLPSSVFVPLSSKLMPTIFSRLVAHWLEPAIPVELDNMPDFESLVHHLTEFVKFAISNDLEGYEEFSRWIADFPRLWLSRKKEHLLKEVRDTGNKSISIRKQVERTEQQQLVKSDTDQTWRKNDVKLDADQEQTNGAWDSEWADEDAQGKATLAAEEVSAEHNEDEADASAWGLEDDDETGEEVNADNDVSPSTPTANERSQATEEGDDWENWADEDAKQEQTQPHLAASSDDGPETVTLSEHYAVTETPDSIMAIIKTVIRDAEALLQPEYADFTIANAATGLYTIPTLLLAMYRATADTVYATEPAGNMLLYNDCFRFSEVLNGFLEAQREKDALSELPSNKLPSSRLRLDPDINSLESYGKRAYGTEMESQRTILRDLMDGAQGFTSVSTPPFAAECDNAVAMTIDRIREVDSQWRDVLSRSALLQSLGSLFATVANKMILDIEEMSDITEEDSKRLRHFCDEIFKLQDLFVVESPHGEQNMGPLYIPNWFKLSYLSEILVGSLADIRWMWNDGELKLEFTAEEIVDLMEALFSDSDHRRRAITDIKRTA